MHIGLTGGIGPAATEHYYRGLMDRYAASGGSPDLTIVQADVRDLVRNLANQDAKRQADIFARLVERLAAAGADAAAVTSMGGHFCIRELEAVSALPMLSALPEVDAAIRRRNLKTVGILGNRLVMETRLYGRISSATVVLPEGDRLEQVHECYREIALEGRITDAQRALFFSEGQRMCRDQDVEAVMLGGTDLLLAFQGQDCGFPVIDCAGIHIDAIYQWSLGKAQ
jgi:aspartate racemase